MNEYLMICEENCDTALQCKSCEFKNKSIISFYNEETLKKEWCKAIVEGKKVRIYKHMDFVLQDCNHEYVYNHTIDKALPFGEIESEAIFKCTKCGEEISETELSNNEQ